MGQHEANWHDKWPTKVRADSASVFEMLRMDLSQRILVLFKNDKHFRMGGINC